MAFNTTSFVAGASAVVAVLSTGLAGGYYLASPSHIDPPNRLQRLAAANQDRQPAPVPAVAPAAAKPEVVADVAPAAAAVPAAAPVVAPPASKLSDAKALEPAHTAAIQETAAPAPTVKPDTDAKATEKVNTDKARAADARAAERNERKRSETRKIAEQRRKQRELDVATVAVRRIIHERGPSDIVVDSDQAEAPAPEMTHFNLFGQ